MNAVQQLQQEMSKVATSPEEYQNMVLAMKKMDEFARQPNVQQLQEGGLVQKQEQEGVGAYVPPPKQTFDISPEKEPVQMQTGGATPFDTPNPTKITPTTTTPTGQYTGQNVGDISAEMIETPKLPTGAVIEPAKTTVDSNQLIMSGQGQVAGQVAIPTALAGTATAQGVVKTPAQQMQEQQVQQQVKDITDATQAQQGTVTQPITPQTLDKVLFLKCKLLKELQLKWSILYKDRYRQVNSYQEQPMLKQHHSMLNRYKKQQQHLQIKRQ